MTAVSPVAAPGPAAEASFTVDGNRLTLLPTGAERLDALLGLIEGARASLRILYYIYGDDVAGARVRDAMLAAARRGVHVAIIVDGFGSALPDDYFEALKAAGGDVCQFLPRYGRRYLLRNHQKLALADEARVLIGGFNVAAEYFDDTGGWRDLGLCIDGPAAARLAGYFDALRDWTHRDRARIKDLRRTIARWSETGDSETGARETGDGRIRWLFGGPTRRLSPWADTIRRDMGAARRLDIIAAYFAPNPRMLRRIELVARTGGAARVVTAAKSDNGATIAAARHTYRRLLKRGVRLFEYQPRKLHTKLFVIDDVVHIGSANFDVRSLYLNLELMVRIEDAAFAKRMRAYAEGEIADSKEVTRAAHARAGWLDRLRWSAAYFLVTVVDGNLTRRLNFGPDGR